MNEIMEATERTIHIPRSFTNLPSLCIHFCK